MMDTVEARVERKLMSRLVSVIFLLYFLFSVDRGNVGFAALQMTNALGLSAEGFGIGSGLFTFGYLLFQIPNAMWLRRLGGGRAFAVIACAWGAVSAATAFVPNEFWFLANRFLLGVAEAGFNAFVIYYIHSMFPSGLRGFAVGLTFIAVPASLVIASPLSGALLNLQVGDLRGWQLLFIIEGVPTIVVGLLALGVIPASVADIKFLSPEEHRWLIGELETEDGGEVIRGRRLGAAIVNPVAWALGYILFTTVFMVNVMLIWMPQIIKQMSHAGNVEVGLLNSLPWVSLGLGVVLVSRISDKVANRVAALVPSLAAAAVGFLLAAAAQDRYPLLALIGLLLGAFGGGAAQGVFWALTMERIRGPNAATAYAFITVLGNGSGVFAHPLIGKLHDRTGSFGAIAWALAGFNLAAIAVAYSLNRSRAR